MSSEFYKIVVGDQIRIVSRDKAMEVAGEMVQGKGGLIPDIKPCDEQGNILELAEKEEEECAIWCSIDQKCKRCRSDDERNSTTQKVAPVYSDFGAGNQVMDTKAAARLSATYDKMEAGGITGIERNQTAMGYTPGMRMAQIGYDTQAQRKLDHQNKMPVVQVIEELNAAITSERRREVEVSSKELINSISEFGPLTTMGFRLTEHAIKGLFTRLNTNTLGLKASGLARILELGERIDVAIKIQEKNRISHISPAIAKYDEVAKMIEADRREIAHCLKHELARFPEIKLQLRLRENPAINDIFAVLSPAYSVADATMITPELLKSGIPNDARGNWEYDPATTAWSIEIATWTPTDTLEQVIGEPVSGFINFSSSDAGNGRLNGDGGCLIIQCLNASLYSAGDVEVSRVHRGRVIFDAAKMLRAALHSINRLSEAWGNNRKIEVEQPPQINSREFLDGCWRALLNKGELAGVLVGRKENHIPQLTRCYEQERRDHDKLVRADFAQAFSKHIQSQPYETQRDAERAVGNWLAKPTKMLYELK